MSDVKSLEYPTLKVFDILIFILTLNFFKSLMKHWQIFINYLYYSKLILYLISILISIIFKYIKILLLYIFKLRNNIIF